jgi:erythronate-4-phosphate dehydrogenase
MKIIADENIIFAREAFSGLGDVHLYNGRNITNDILKDADALLVRSITKVNSALLDNTNVKFVGTATIGTDHVDTTYLAAKGIYFTDAKGCNSDAVAEYVFTALFNIAKGLNFLLKDKTIAVVGVGNIGSRIVRLAKSLGMNVLQNDPPLKRKTGGKNFLELNELLNADIITFHVPLNMEGEDKTFHLFNHEKLNSLKDGAIIINASRGPVVENNALFNLIDQKKFTAVLDVWEEEPGINKALLKKVKFGSPHIAGYSYEGKINGTVILYKALCSFLNSSPLWVPEIPVPGRPFIKLNGNSGTEDELFKAVDHIYKINEDDKNLRGVENSDEPGKYFDNLRKNYNLRREFPNFFIDIVPPNNELSEICRSFRFNSGANNRSV